MSSQPYSSDLSSREPQPSKLAFVLNLANNVTQLALGGVVISALITPNMLSLSGSYAQHIVLCTIGYFVMMAQAVLAFSPYGWAAHMKYEHRKIVHYMMQIVGSILVITGSSVRIANVYYNFNTAHGICGFIAMLLTISTFVLGVLSLKFPKQMNTKITKLIHAVLGSATILTAFVALIYAFHYYYRTVVGDANANNAIVFSVFALIGTLLMATIKHVKILFL